LSATVKQQNIITKLKVKRSSTVINHNYNYYVIYWLCDIRVITSINTYWIEQVYTYLIVRTSLQSDTELI